MRDFLDDILEEIDQEPLTDEEYAGTQPLADEEYSEEVYDALKEVLEDRESVSDALTRLKAYFVARGLVLAADARTPASQILIGTVLD